MSKDFRIKIGVRNNALLECIERSGHTMGVKFCRDAGVPYQHVIDFVAMRLSPIKDGDWRPTVLRLADFLGVSPEEMFHTCHVEPLKKHVVERKADAQEVYDLLNAPEPDDPTVYLEHKDRAEIMDRLLDSLSPREKEVLERCVMGNETREEVGKSFGLSRARISQIEGKALRKLRHPSRSGLREFSQYSSWSDDQDIYKAREEEEEKWSIHNQPEWVIDKPNGR